MKQADSFGPIGTNESKKRKKRRKRLNQLILSKSNNLENIAQLQNLEGIFIDLFFK